MDLGVIDTLNAGIERSFKRSSVLIFLVFSLHSFLSSVIDTNTLYALQRDGFVLFRVEEPSMNLDIGLRYLLVLSVFLMVLLVSIYVVAIRVLVSHSTDAVHPEHYSNLLYPVLQAAVGGLFVGVVIVLGFFLLIIPGLYLYIRLYFYIYYISVEDVDFIEAIKRSWDLTKGNTWKLFLLHLVYLVLFISVLMVVSITSLALMRIGEAVDVAFISLVSGYLSMLGVSVFALAFNRLQTAQEMSDL